MSRPKRVVVIGAGAVGMCSALFLQKLGCQVTVIDRVPPGEGCSFGNAGGVVPSSMLPEFHSGVITKLPGWLLEITNGEEMLLVTDYGSERYNMPYVEPVVYQDERRTQYVVDEYNTTVEIRGERCTDVMSGQEFEVSVTIFQADRELSGCGRALF